jgi:hypothetical protein
MTSNDMHNLHVNSSSEIGQQIYVTHFSASYTTTKSIIIIIIIITRCHLYAGYLNYIPETNHASRAGVAKPQLASHMRLFGI